VLGDIVIKGEGKNSQVKQKETRLGELLLVNFYNLG